MPPHLQSSNSAHGQLATQLSRRRKREASELRKTLKPLMEKRRRARINDSLNKLKTLILPLIGKDSPRYSKLEKADILEMTVQFLHNLPKSPLHDRLDSYREGYRACLVQLTNLLPSSELVGREECGCLMDFLERCMDPPQLYHHPISQARVPACPEGAPHPAPSQPNGRAARTPSSPGASARQRPNAISRDLSPWRPWLPA
ncbi:transcription factor HES-2-like [Leucoraja erinacea]|uniref:transcription factor HES-2-like n=1 Tax=Leucoraja erinaceus TaxID=7782 RepID=UPI002457EA90|nr:transcription factor HES-2-like [Leucoraja erinacea]